MRKLCVVLALLPAVVMAAGCGASEEVAADIGAVVGMIDRANLTAGAANLQQWYQANGTYAGADPGVPGVTLVRADSAGWCLQTANAHEAGPNGTPAPGPC